MKGIVLKSTTQLKEGDLLLPVNKVVEVDQELEARQSTGGTVSHVPHVLSYRATLKNSRTLCSWLGKKTVTYWIGLLSITLAVKVETSKTGRRIVLNGKELVREKVLPQFAVTSNETGEASVWKKSFHYRHLLDEKDLTTISIFVHADQKVELFVDGIHVDGLRRSSIKIKGSPPPPPPLNLESLTKAN